MNWIKLWVDFEWKNTKKVINRFYCPWFCDVMSSISANGRKLTLWRHINSLTYDIITDQSRQETNSSWRSHMIRSCRRRQELLKVDPTSRRRDVDPTTTWVVWNDHEKQKTSSREEDEEETIKYTHTDTQTYTQTLTHIHTNTHRHTHWHKYTQNHTHTFTQTHRHTHTNTDT